MDHAQYRPAVRFVDADKDTDAREVPKSERNESPRSRYRQLEQVLCLPRQFASHRASSTQASASRDPSGKTDILETEDFRFAGCGHSRAFWSYRAAESTRDPYPAVAFEPAFLAALLPALRTTAVWLQARCILRH